MSCDLRSIRNWKVAAPLKLEWWYLCPSPPIINPQLKSCGSIEAFLGYTFLFVCLTTIRNWKVAAPLKQSTDYFDGISTSSTIRNWKVAAPLKLVLNGVNAIMFWNNPQLKSCGSIEAIHCHWHRHHYRHQSATEKLRLHWSTCGLCQDQGKKPSIRNWKVAAPLKRMFEVPLWQKTGDNPQLKSCGSIEAPTTLRMSWICCKQSATEKLRLHWSSNMGYSIDLNDKQSATEKLRLHWSPCPITLPDHIPPQSATEKLRLHWSLKSITHWR